MAVINNYACIYQNVQFLPAALAEAGLEITFKVGHRPIVGGGGRDICPPPPPNLAGEVVTFVHLPCLIWRGRLETLVHRRQDHWVALHATTAKTTFAWSG